MYSNTYRVVHSSSTLVTRTITKPVKRLIGLGVVSFVKFDWIVSEVACSTSIVLKDGNAGVYDRRYDSVVDIENWGKCSG